ncbi:MAG TPA: glycosyl hydrolase [Candidatus Eisenbacteria bacterium]|nr:glycosyl hydrolase [Candidatus Eisenbacteria bacterium]
MGPYSFHRISTLVARSILTLAVLLSGSLLCQTKPERQSKAAKSAKSAQSAQPPAASADKAKNEGDVEESSKPEEKAFKGMKYRLIGPFRGGRSLTAAGIPGDPTTYYFGATGGGVWKSTDGAMTWSSVFDKEGTSAIGSIAVANSNHNIVYVGTGEACIRGNISHGDGVYKTLDGGKNWKNVGLKDSRAIGKVIVNPTNPDIVFVAALGHPYGPNIERGIFRTTDGGKTWDKVLYKDENTGGVDVAFDPHNPNTIFAALWQARRTSWSMTSGGPGSGLYRSTDGGTTWKHLEEHGLPKGPYGKIGVAVAANSDRVYALIEAHNPDGGLYRSDDGGESWELVNASHSLWQRPWYYMHVIADPRDENVLYIMDVDAYKSTDGGHLFNKVRVPHGDNHGLWIDPLNTRRMIASNDGGVTVTLDGGKNWTPQDNQPTAQFYHVITDAATPYRVYGAQQDSGTVAIISRSDDGSISQNDWYDVGGGEAGYIAPYPPDPNIVYAADYQGNITRYDRHIGQVKEITEQPELSDAHGAANLEHRFQWTAPVMISPHDPNTLYHGGEVLFKTTDGGVHWQPISPDLTRNDKEKQKVSGGDITLDDSGTEYYDTIFALAESPITKGLIWVGTDDGLIQLTRDEGKTWTNVTPKDMPEWSRISQIDPSPLDAGTAYVAVDRHQFDELKPYIYKTADYGKTWTKLGQGIPDRTFVRVVREDPKKRGLLYAGTEEGVYVSFNDGANWRPLKLNLPTTPVHDLVIKDNDLVVATHGRAFWILDDLSPLRQYSDEVAQKDIFLYTPATAYRIQAGVGGERHPSKRTGQNPPAGAVIYYFLKDAPKSDTEAKVEILDASGNVIRKYSSTEYNTLEEPPDPDDKKPEKELKPEAGLNRFVWDLRYEEAHRVPGYYLWEYGNGARGPVAVPGHYQVRLTVGGKSQAAGFDLKLDPRVKVSQADLEAQFNLLLQTRDELSKVYDTVNQIQDVRSQLAGLKRRLPENASVKTIVSAADDLDKKLSAVRDDFVNLEISANEDSLAYPPQLDAKLAFLAMAAGGADSAPTEAEQRQFEKLKRQSGELISRWEDIQRRDLAAFQKLAAEGSLTTVMVPPAGKAVEEPVAAH